jgi:hypothetical protein
MLERPYAPNAYNLGLSWRVPSEVPAQHALQQELLAALSGARSVAANQLSNERLKAWIASLPVTGRVPVAVADVRWLQANPLRDPILQPGHSVDWPSRPATVTVVQTDGTLCQVKHAGAREASHYLQACSRGTLRADVAWVAQPDGRVQRFGIAAWNREVQSAIAPGAWLWAPPRHGGWREDFSIQLITFLATQGPAPDSTPVSAIRQTEKSPSAVPAGVSRATAGGASLGFGAKPPVMAAGLTVSSVLTETPTSQVSIPSRSLAITASDWGNMGLLQTPNARMQRAGHFSFTWSRTVPYTRGNVFFQPFDWLEAGFRYVDINNRAYDASGALQTTQTYKDKSFDFKARLWPESAYLPQVAVGVRDAAGTGLFSGEYVVASKRTDRFDWSLGLGWGYLAGRSRNLATVGQGGLPSYQNFFRGGYKPFGGVQYQTPWENVVLKLEYDGNNFQNEPQSNNQTRRSPWNFGLVYRAGKNADITLGIERGNTVVLGISLHAQLDGLSIPKLLDPPRVPVAESRPAAGPRDWKATTAAIQQQSGWRVGEVMRNERELHLKFDDAGSPYSREQLDKAAAVVPRDAPPQKHPLK